MIAGLRVAVECEECGDDSFVYEDECGRMVCEICAVNLPCEEE